MYVLNFETLHAQIPPVSQDMPQPANPFAVPSADLTHWVIDIATAYKCEALQVDGCVETNVSAQAVPDDASQATLPLETDWFIEMYEEQSRENKPQREGEASHLGWSKRTSSGSQAT